MTPIMGHMFSLVVKGFFFFFLQASVYLTGACRTPVVACLPLLSHTTTQDASLQRKNGTL